MTKKLLIIITCLIFLCGCESKTKELDEIKENPIVTMTFKDYGDITIELYPHKALNTVANFVNLVEDGFYDGNGINRVQKGFVIQAGGLKDPGYTIKGEFNSNGFKNDLLHEEGVISMARSGNPDSAGGQFFIMLDKNTALDGEYAAFGKVIEGMDIIHKIEEADHDYQDEMYFFINDYITIEKAIVDTKGHTYKVKKVNS